MKKTCLIFFNIVSLLAIFLCSCKSTKIIDAPVLKLNRDFCEPALAAQPVSGNSTSKYVAPTLQEDSLVQEFLTGRDCIIANATGTIPVISNMLKHAGDSSLSGQLLFQLNSNKIHDEIQDIRITMDALLAELDCEATRTREISSYLTKLSKRANSSVIVASIIAGALTTIAPVYIKGESQQNAIAVGTGSLSVALAVISLHPFGKKVKFFHFRNLLSDIWYQPELSTIYRPELWYLLKNKNLSNVKDVSRVQIVKMRWLKFYLDNKLDSDTEQLLFQNGGIYNNDNLDLRASMLNELRFAIRSINQDLQLFIAKIDNLGTTAAK